MAVIITALSKISRTKEDIKKTINEKERENFNGYLYKNDITEPYEYYYTNEAPLKYLVDINKDKLEDLKIFCIRTKEVNCDEIKGSKDNGTTYAYYENFLINELGINKKNIVTVDYYSKKENEEEKLESLALSLYKDIYEHIRKDNSKEIYIDYTGAYRETNYLMVSLIRYLSTIGCDCKKIVYAYLPQGHVVGEIRELNYIYDIDNLTEAVNYFISSGSTEKLEECFPETGQYKEIENLIQSLREYVECIWLGGIYKIEGARNQIKRKILELPYKPKDLKEGIFLTLKENIQNGLKLLTNRSKYGSVDTCYWCIEHGYIQQAISICVEKYPEIYCELGINSLNIPHKNVGRGHNEQHDMFYTSFIESLPIDEEYEEFNRKITNSYNTIDIERVRRQGKFYERDFNGTWSEKEKVIIDEIINCLNGTTTTAFGITLQGNDCLARYKSLKNNGKIYKVAFDVEDFDGESNKKKYKRIKRIIDQDKETKEYKYLTDICVNYLIIKELRNKIMHLSNLNQETKAFIKEMANTVGYSFEKGDVKEIIEIVKGITRLTEKLQEENIRIINANKYNWLMKGII